MRARLTPFYKIIFCLLTFLLHPFESIVAQDLLIPDFFIDDAIEKIMPVWSDTHKEPVFSVLNCQLKDGLYGPYVFYNDSDKTFVVTYFSVEDNKIGREFRVTGIPNKFARTMKMLFKAAVLSSTYGKLSIWSSEASSYHISFHGMEAYYLSFDSDFYGRKYPLFSNSREGEKIPELFSIIDRVFFLFEEGETEKLNELIPRMKALTRRFRGYYTK